MKWGFKHSTDFQDNYSAQPSWSTVLSADLNAADTIVHLASVDGLPPKGYVTIEEETIFYDYIDAAASTLGDATHPVTRDIYNDNPVFHPQGSTVEQRIAAVAWMWLMRSVKKRKRYLFQSNQIPAGTVQTQDIEGFASRVRMADLRIIPTGGSLDFVVELYRTGDFKGKDRIFKSSVLYCAETTLVADASIGDDTLQVNDTGGFVVGELVVIGDFSGTYEYGRIKEIEDGVSITLYDAIENDYTSGTDVRFVHQDTSDFYYEDLDWKAFLHTRIINNDMASPVTVYFDIIAEVSDE